MTSDVTVQVESVDWRANPALVGCRNPSIHLILRGQGIVLPIENCLGDVMPNEIVHGQRRTASWFLGRQPSERLSDLVVRGLDGRDRLLVPGALDLSQPLHAKRRWTERPRKRLEGEILEHHVISAHTWTGPAGVHQRRVEYHKLFVQLECKRIVVVEFRGPALPVSLTGAACVVEGHWFDGERSGIFLARHIKLPREGAVVSGSNPLSQASRKRRKEVTIRGYVHRAERHEMDDPAYRRALESSQNPALREIVLDAWQVQGRDDFLVPAWGLILDLDGRDHLVFGIWRPTLCGAGCGLLSLETGDEIVATAFDDNGVLVLLDVWNATVRAFGTSRLGGYRRQTEPRFADNVAPRSAPSTLEGRITPPNADLQLVKALPISPPLSRVQSIMVRGRNVALDPRLADLPYEQLQCRIECDDGIVAAWVRGDIAQLSPLPRAGRYTGRWKQGMFEITEW